MMRITFLLLFACYSAFGQTDSLTPVQVAPVNRLPDTTIIVKDTLIPRNQKLVIATQKETNGSPYTLCPVVDIPIIAVGTGWSVYAFTKIYSKGSSTEEQINALSKSDIPSIDRSAVRPYRQSLDKFSYYPFYAAIPLPLVYTLIDNRTRPDFWKISFLYWEAMSVSGLLGTGATYFVDRYRPYTYDARTPMDKRLDQNAKNSFYAGHVNIVGTSTFFIAKIFNDYHQDSPARWIVFTGAAAATGWMAYMRYEAGMHFPSDIALAIVQSSLTGILVPEFHKHHDRNLSILPYRQDEAYGLSINYRPR